MTNLFSFDFGIVSVIHCLYTCHVSDVTIVWGRGRGVHGRGQHLKDPTMSADLVRLPSLAASRRTLGNGRRDGQPSEDPLGALWSKPLSAKPEGRIRVPPIRYLPREWRVAPRPGDVFRPGPKDWNKPRPLGLLPDRERDFDPFFFFEPPPPVSVGLSRMLAPLLRQKERSDGDEQALGASQAQSRAFAVGEHSPHSFDGAGPVPYRSSSEWRPAPSQEAAPPPGELREREYLEALVRMAEMDTLSRRPEREEAAQLGGARVAGKERLHRLIGRDDELEDVPHLRPPLNVSVHALLLLLSVAAWCTVL